LPEELAARGVVSADAVPVVSARDDDRRRTADQGQAPPTGVEHRLEPCEAAPFVE
jgi:hypothetical protein